MWIVKKATITGTLYFQPAFARGREDLWWHRQANAHRYHECETARRAADRVDGYVVRLATSVTPRHGAAVHLTIEEAKALRDAVTGDAFDSSVMNSAIAQIDQAMRQAPLARDGQS